MAHPGAQFPSAAWAPAQFPSSVPAGGLLIRLWLLLMEPSLHFAARGTTARVCDPRRGSARASPRRALLRDCLCPTKDFNCLSSLMAAALLLSSALWCLSGRVCRVLVGQPGCSLRPSCDAGPVPAFSTHKATSCKCHRGLG